MPRETESVDGIVKARAAVQGETMPVAPPLFPF